MDYQKNEKTCTEQGDDVAKDRHRKTQSNIPISFSLESNSKAINIIINIKGFISSLTAYTEQTRFDITCSLRASTAAW